MSKYHLFPWAAFFFLSCTHTGKGAGFVFLWSSAEGSTNAWTQQASLTPVSSTANDDRSCGDSVAVSGYHLAVGAPGDALGVYRGTLRPVIVIIVQHLRVYVYVCHVIMVDMTYGDME